MDTKLDTLISKMEESRSRLKSALGNVAPSAEIYPTWEIKQLMDHITGWDELVISTLQQYARGEAPGLLVREGIHRYNAESVSRRASISLEQSRSDFDSTRQQVITLLRQFPPDRLSQKYPAPWGGTCTVPSVMKIFISHELEHAKHIEELLEKPD